MFGLIQIVASLAVMDAAESRSWPHPGIVFAQSASPLEIPKAEVPAETEPPAGASPGSEPEGEDLTQTGTDEPMAGADEDEETSPDDLNLGEIPVIETMELTPDIAKRALDTYLSVRRNFENSDLDQYEDLQDFVDQTAEGKAFEAEVKAAGFANVNEWNLAITAVSFAYTSVVDDQSAELLQQIAEIEADTELAQDMKDRMIAALRAMIPSENNKKVITDLMADQIYLEKLKQLDIEEE